MLGNTALLVPQMAAKYNVVPEIRPASETGGVWVETGKRTAAVAFDGR
jgi:hypothetical protein